MILNRRRILATLGGLAVAGITTSAYGFGVEPFLRLRVQHHKLRPARWPAALTLRVAQLSDLHAGAPFMDEERIEQIVARTNALAPDLVLLTGDFGPACRGIDRVLPHIAVARRLAGLRAPLGVFAVNGNHDWWEDAEAMHRGLGAVPAMARKLARYGIRTLSNEVVQAGPVLVGGLDSQWAFRVGRGAADVPRMLGQVTGDAPLLLMAHEPDIFAILPARATVTFSGHTHGGQVRLLGWSPVTSSRLGNRYAYGHVREDGRDLIVSGGLGVSMLPIRFGVPPEITLVEISA